MPEAARLDGLRIVVTRPVAQSEGLAQALRAEGAAVVLLPAVEIRVSPDLTTLEQALRRLEGYDWVIFTSANAVEITAERMQRIGVPLAQLAGRRVAAIGPATAAALTTRGVQPDFVPTEFIGESLARGLGPLQGKRILLPRAEGARQALPAGLVEQGASVDEIGIYRAATPPAPPAGLRQLAQGVEAVTFTSPSTVRGFIQLARQAGLDPQKLPGTPCLACIGPITAAAARREGLRADIVASRYTADGLVEALISHFQQEVPACSN